MDNLQKIFPTKKTGQEKLIIKSNPTGYSLLDFWTWSVSDLVSNATRGRLAEFIIATSTGVDLTSVRGEWDAYDLITPKGIKIEVKSAAYLQSWYQKNYSTISFSIKEARHWDSETNQVTHKSARSADVYVFCLLKHMDKITLDPLNLDQWEFFVVPVKTINNYTRSKTSITLKSLGKLASPVKYDEVKKAVQECLRP